MTMPPPAYVPGALSEMAARGHVHRSVDSSLVFADVSGFTPLTERLARRGRDGSEHLTDLLNALFGPTLDLALDHGGDLLSFGGDALLIHFVGPRHEQRARRAAVGMSHCFGETARRTRSRVGMSVGVASGLVHLHRVGSRFDLLVVHGPAVQEVLRLEAAADEGTVLAVDGPLDVQPEPPPPRRPEPDRSVRHDLAGRIDPNVARAIAEDVGDEHRRSVVTFLRFAVADGPIDEVHEAIGHVVAVVDRACEATGVTLLNSDIDPLGGKLTLTAGVPSTTGDDADRMLEAALRIRDAMHPGQDVRIGVNEGPLFAGPVGSARRRSYTIMGDDVNLAARVAGRAGPRQVLATAAVCERARQPFDLEPLEPFPVKGKSAPVHAAAVLGIDERTRTRPDHRVGRLRGRDAELTALLDLAERCRSRTGALVEVVAPAGVGKSRLVGELRDRAGLPEVIVEGGRYLASTAYGAVTEAVRRMIGAAPSTPTGALRALLEDAVTEHAPQLVEWLPLLAVPFGIGVEDNEVTAALSDEFRRDRVHQLVAELLTAMTATPHLLVVEDAHWLDEAGAELLDSQARRFTDAGWLVVATRRPEPTGWVPTDLDLRLELAPLDHEATRQLAIDASSERPLPDHVMSRLIERSHGHPLFLEQLVRSAAAGTDPDELPDRVEVLIEARIDRLPPRQRSALRTASVLGARFPPDLLDAVEAGAVAALADVEDLVSIGPTEIRFAHALYRDTAYVALPGRRRRVLHRAAAEAIEASAGPDRSSVLELLAEHWDRAGEVRRAWPMLRAAADRAARDLAPYEALRFLERARRSAPRLGPAERAELVEVDEQLGVLAETIGRYDEAERAFRRARRRSDDPADLARLLGLEARVARSARSLGTSARRFRRALEIAPPDAHRVRADLLVGLSSVLERQGRHRDKLPVLEVALVHATACGDPDVLAHAHLLLGNAHGDLGDPAAMGHLEQALRLFESTGNVWGIASARNNLGVEAYYSGDWDESAEHYRAAAEGYQRLGDETNHAMALNNIGEIHSDQGRFDEALTEFTDARRMWRAVGFSLGVGLASSNLGRVAARQGRFDEARVEFDEARGVFESIDAKGFLFELDARVAAALVAEGSAREGLDLADRTLADGAELQPTVRCQLLRTRALGLAALGDHESAASALAAASTLAESIDAPQEVAECERTRAIVAP